MFDSYPRALVFVLAIAPAGAIAACSSSSSSSGGTTPAAAVAQDSGTPAVDSGSGGDAGAPTSVCGHPGDMGNSLGVGMYCNTAEDAGCPSTAPICSDIENAATPSMPTFFCVQVCNECSPPGFCGSGASCVCQAPGECGCTPNSCSALFPDAGNGPCTAGDGGGSDAGTSGD